MSIDLHTHSTASDGQYSPSEVIRMAKSSGIELIAISDHDTVGGLTEAMDTAAACNMICVPAIEISTQDLEEIHILGYGISYSFKPLLRECDRWRRDRDNRGTAIKAYLNTKGIDVNLDIVKNYAGTGNLGRPHFARYLLEHGFVSNRKEAFDRYLDTDEFREATDRKKPAPEKAIELIHLAGGKAVLAHPGIYRMDEETLDDLFKRLVDLGIDGVECFYSRHSKEQTSRYLGWIKKYDLKLSCGSDFHGERVKSDISLGMEFDWENYGRYLVVDKQGELVY